MNSVFGSIRINNMAITKFKMDNNKIKILLVDDSEIIRERLKEVLGHIPFPTIICQAQDAIEAMKQLKAIQQDIVILDIKMPGENGIEFLKKLKRINKSIFVIILTNYSAEQYKKKCIELGADLFLSKSKDFEMISGIIQEIHDNFF